MSFSDNFWPQLWATLVGVPPALLGAWWFERRLHLAGDKRELARALDRSTSALDVVRTTIDFNASSLAQIADYLQIDQIVMTPDLRGDVWVSAQSQILPSETDAQLALELSGYFEAIAHYGRVMELLGEQTFGTAAALGGSKERRARLMAVVSEKGPELIDTSRDLSRRVTEAVSAQEDQARLLR